MNEFIDIFDKWSEKTQLIAFSISSFLVLFFLYLVFRLLVRSVCIIFRGYPIFSGATCRYQYPKIQTCEHDDNVTGKCLKSGGCRTTGECEITVNAINKGQ